MMDKKGSVNLLSRVFLMISFFIVVFAACSRENYPDDKPDVPKVDTTAPVIKVLHASVDITGVEEITIRTNALYIGELLVATWSDNVTTNCRVSMTINGNNITSGSVPIVSGTLTLTVTDDAGNSTTATIKLTMKETHPDITIYHTEVNVFGGVQLGISYDHLTIDGELVMAWSDKTTSQCKVAVSQGDRELKDGDMLSEVGMLKVVVTNGQGKSSTGEIELVSNPIEGLENLYAAELQVGKETDLLDGLTFVNGATLVKTEIEMDGTRSTIEDATHFTPEFPGQCNIIFTVQGQDGTTTQVVAENLTIKPMEYNEPIIATADMINTHYPWFNRKTLPTSIKEHRAYLYPYLLISYAACNHSILPNRVILIVAETSPDVDENIGNETPSLHGENVCNQLRAMCPTTNIKGAYMTFEPLEEYLNQHPDSFYFLSCSIGFDISNTKEEFATILETKEHAKSLLRIFNKKNVIFVNAVGNFYEGDGWLWTAQINESHDKTIEYGTYQIPKSVNSHYDNHVTVIGEHSWAKKNYHRMSIDFASEAGDSIQPTYSLLPVGFYKEVGNFAMPMAAALNAGTASSFPTATACGMICNAVSVFMTNHPDVMTPADAMTFIINNYLEKELCLYSEKTDDDTWVLTTSEDCVQYRFLPQKFLDNELLQAEKLERLTLNGDDVELPFGRGICYLGKGVQFELDGKRHDISETAALTEALKAGNAKWYWNRCAFRRYGDANTVDLHVHIVDKNGEKFPDLELNITKPVI